MPNTMSNTMPNTMSTRAPLKAELTTTTSFRIAEILASRLNAEPDQKPYDNAALNEKFAQINQDAVSRVAPQFADSLDQLLSRHQSLLQAPIEGFIHSNLVTALEDVYDIDPIIVLYNRIMFILKKVNCRNKNFVVSITPSFPCIGVYDWNKGDPQSVVINYFMDEFQKLGYNSNAEMIKGKIIFRCNFAQKVI